MLKTEARLESEKWMSLLTEGMLLDIRLTRAWLEGNRSEKIKRVIKKCTKRIERRLEKSNLALERMK